MPKFTWPKFTCIAAALVLAQSTAVRSQGLTFVAGSTSTALDVIVIDEAHPALPGNVLLQGIELLPIEMSGRLLEQECDAAHARRLVRNGLTRIELPGGGRLFSYRRASATQWGFLFVPAGGQAMVLLELPGGGLNGTDDPFLDRIAVAPDGLHALLPLVSGDCHVARLDGGTFASTGLATRFVPVAAGIEGTSMVGSNTAFLPAGHNRIWRLPLADGGVPSECTPIVGTSNNRLGSFALSGDGNRIAFLYGPQNAQQLFVLGATGAAVAMPLAASHLEDPGYLPEGPGMGSLRLNDDGSRLFCIDAALREESYLLDTSGQLPTLQITSDTIFQPYIGVHILPSFAATTLLVAIGDVNLMDWFRADLTPGGGTVQNLTGTGSLVQPFPAGTLVPQRAARIGQRLLATDLVGTSQVLRSIDPASGQSTVLFSDLQQGPVAGSSFTATPDVVVSGAGDRLFSGLTGSLLLPLPDGVQLLPPGSCSLYSATCVHIGTLGVVALYYPGVVLTGPVETGIGQVGLTQTGGLVIRGATSRYLAPGVSATLSLPPAPVCVLISGAGA